MKIVFVGGFGAGRHSTEKTGERLATATGAEDLKVFTFSDRKKRMSEIIESMKRADRIDSHSAGALVVAEGLGELTKATRITMFNAPMPTSASALVAQGLPIAAHMLGDAIRKPSLFLPTVDFGCCYVAELVVHPRANLGALGSQGIPAFNSNSAALEMVDRGHRVSVVDMQSDEYFRRHPLDLERLRRHRVGYAELEGHHNRLLVDTGAVIAELDAAA